MQAQLEQNTYRAIADPTRRQIIDLLARERMTKSDLSSHFSITRQAIAKHIKILHEAQLLKEFPEGRERRIQLNPQPLKEIQSWISRYELLWEGALNKLGKHLDSDNKKKRR